MDKYTISDDVMSEDILVWAKYAQCKGHPAEWFFSETMTTREGRFEVAQAKELCTACIVRNNCLRYADENDESFGIWGGLTPQERGYRRVGRARKG